MTEPTSSDPDTGGPAPLSKVVSPKLAGATASWYRYYAGYSPAFVRQVLESLALPEGGTILDPWNGSGTTTSVARAGGYRAVGFDLNPALVVIARARLVGAEAMESLVSLGTDLLRHASSSKVAPDDPLRQWFDESSADQIRSIERAINEVLVDEHGGLLITRPSLSGVSSLACLYLVALFDVVSELVANFRGSNPTWVRVLKEGEHPLTVDRTRVHTLFTKAINRLAATERSAPSRNKLSTRVLVGDSRGLPLRSASVDATIASPPYCTRLDYVVATLPELAVLGYSRADVRGLRDATIGTPTMTGAKLGPSASWGHIATATYDLIKAHRSHASSGYYAKYVAQYLDSMARSVQQISRVAKPGGYLCLVAQDSYYKELRIDLPSILIEMATLQSWAVVSMRNFPVANTRAAIHPGTRDYRSTFEANEALLLLQRPLTAEVVDNQP